MTLPPDMTGLQNTEILRSVLEVISTGVVLLDRRRKIIFWNSGAEKITGFHSHDALGHNSQANILAQCNEISCIHCGASCPLTQVVHNGEPIEMQGYLHHKAGHSVPVHLRVHPIRDLHGSLIALAESFDVDFCSTEPAYRDNSLAAHGCLDLVTGVPNHAFTQSHLRENLAFFNEYHLPFGVLWIDVEHIAELNATHGREAADVMLHVIAQTMKHTLRPDGFLGRWAERQFLAIVTNCESADLRKIAENVHKMASTSGIQWWDDLLVVAVSVGHAMVQSGDTTESILSRAHSTLLSERLRTDPSQAEETHSGRAEG